MCNCEKKATETMLKTRCVSLRRQALMKENEAAHIGRKEDRTDFFDGISWSENLSTIEQHVNEAE